MTTKLNDTLGWLVILTVNGEEASSTFINDPTARRYGEAHELECKIRSQYFDRSCDWKVQSFRVTPHNKELWSESFNDMWK